MNSIFVNERYGIVNINSRKCVTISQINTNPSLIQVKA